MFSTLPEWVNNKNIVLVSIIGLATWLYFRKRAAKETQSQQAIFFPLGMCININHGKTIKQLNIILRKNEKPALDLGKVMKPILQFDEAFSQGKKTEQEFYQFMRNEILQLSQEDVTDQQLKDAWNAMIVIEQKDDLQKHLAGLFEMCQAVGVDLIPFTRTNVIHLEFLRERFALAKTIRTTCEEGVTKDNLLKTILESRLTTHQVMLILPTYDQSPQQTTRERDKQQADGTIKSMEEYCRNHKIVFHSLRGDDLHDSCSQAVAILSPKKKLLA